MIVALGGNDLLRGLNPSTSRDNLDGYSGPAGTKRVFRALSASACPHRAIRARVQDGAYEAMY